MSDDFLVKGWLEQLGDVLVPHIMTGLMRMFQESKKINPHQTCKIFQLGLRRIPQLSTAILQEDYRILLRRGCRPEWLHQMIMGIFATYARAHLVSQGAASDIQIRKRDLEIPDNITFLHLGYIEAARALWTTPYLFSDKYDVIRRQENLEQARRKVLEALQKTVIRQIPFQRLYQRYLVEQDTPIQAAQVGCGIRSQRPSASIPPIDKNPLEKVLETSQEAFATPDLDLDLSIQLPPRTGMAKKPLEKSPTIPPEWVKSPLEPLHIEKVQTLLDNQSTFSSKLKSQIIDRLMTVPEMPAPGEPKEAPNVTLSSTFNLTLPSDEENSASAAFAASDSLHLQTASACTAGQRRSPVETAAKIEERREEAGEELDEGKEEGGEGKDDAVVSVEQVSPQPVRDVVEEIENNEVVQKVPEIEAEVVQEEIRDKVAPEEVIEMVKEVAMEEISQFATGEVETAPRETENQEERGEVTTDKAGEESTIAETVKQTIVIPLIEDGSTENAIGDQRTPDSAASDSLQSQTASEEHNGETGISDSPPPKEAVTTAEAAMALSDDELFQCFDELPPALMKALLQRLQTKITTTEQRPYIRIVRRTPPGSPRFEERRETARTHLLKQRIRHLLQRRSVQMSV